MNSVQATNAASFISLQMVSKAEQRGAQEWVPLAYFIKGG